MEDILVVGSTGNVGSPLLRQLHAAGHRARALVRDERKAKQVAAIAEPVMGDLAKPETLRSAFKGAERVFILSPPIPETET
ncbi:MAG TPA: NAD(P)H-binding protein, partial [Bauldia sp.]|nr:NAD(P)H-binding protein [Bauldia sp.]